MAEKDSAQTHSRQLADCTSGGFALRDPNVPRRNSICAPCPSRPDTISGDGLLMQVSTTSHSNRIAQHDGRDVTGSFKPTESSDSLIGLLTGLKPGKNTLEIRVNGLTRAEIEMLDYASLALSFLALTRSRSFAKQSTMDSGPRKNGTPLQKQSFSVATNPRSRFGDPRWRGSQLISQYGQRVFDPGFKAYDLSVPPPADVAQTGTSDGKTVNYIVRREIGTINRAVYGIQCLRQPVQPLATPWARPKSDWNGRFVYDFDVGCSAGYRRRSILSGKWTAAVADERVCSHDFDAECLRKQLQRLQRQSFRRDDAIVNKTASTLILTEIMTETGAISTQTSMAESIGRLSVLNEHG